jgi:hypothetical protein
MIARVAALSAASALVLAISCGDDPTPQPCTGIPDGGCPRSRGVACEDPACRAVYLCRPGNVWELERVCPSSEAGAFDASVLDAGEDASSVVDANIDAPPGAFGGPGCAALQLPDCTLGFALICPTSDCCGCEDLFVCENGGWSPWGVCGDGGPLSTR